MQLAAEAAISCCQVACCQRPDSNMFHHAGKRDALKLCTADEKCRVWGSAEMLSLDIASSKQAHTRLLLLLLPTAALQLCRSAAKSASQQRFHGCLSCTLETMWALLLSCPAVHQLRCCPCFQSSRSSFSYLLQISRHVSSVRPSLAAIALSGGLIFDHGRGVLLGCLIFDPGRGVLLQFCIEIHPGNPPIFVSDKLIYNHPICLKSSFLHQVYERGVFCCSFFQFGY